MVLIVTKKQIYKKNAVKRSFYMFACERWLRLNHTIQKDSREVLGTSFRFGPTSEILENIQYGGSSVMKTQGHPRRI